MCFLTQKIVEALTAFPLHNQTILERSSTPFVSRKENESNELIMQKPGGQIQDKPVVKPFKVPQPS